MELKLNRTHINPNYTVSYCIMTQSGNKRWFMDRSFQLTNEINSNKVIVGCALLCEDKYVIKNQQEALNEIMDSIIGKCYQILIITAKSDNIEKSIQDSYLLCSLTKREKEIFKLFIRGYTMAQVAKEINLSQRTVEGYLNNLKIKLDCSSKSELIIKAIERKWLIVVI